VVVKTVQLIVLIQILMGLHVLIVSVLRENVVKILNVLKILMELNVIQNFECSCVEAETDCGHTEALGGACE
jgi:hypothetical protein